VTRDVGEPGQTLPHLKDPRTYFYMPIKKLPTYNHTHNHKQTNPTQKQKQTQHAKPRAEPMGRKKLNITLLI